MHFIYIFCVFFSVLQQTLPATKGFYGLIVYTLVFPQTATQLYGTRPAGSEGQACRFHS